MKTILVSGASGIVGYGALRSLRQGTEPFQLIGTSIYTDSVAQAFCDIFELAPSTATDGYLDWLLATIRKHRVDLLIPSIEIDVYAWNEHRDAIAAAGATLLLNSADLIRLCQDKWQFFLALEKQAPAFAIPTRLDGSFDELTAAFGLPFLLKPRSGFASKGIVRVENAATFEAHRARMGSVLMAQPIVGTVEEEYTIGAFFDTSHALCCDIVLKRKLSPEGFTQSAEVASLPHARQALTEIGSALHAVGPTNFQFRVHQGGLKLLEINPRLSSTTSIRTAFGYNESLMSVAYFLDGRRPVQPAIGQGRVVRYVEDHVFHDRAHL